MNTPLIVLNLLNKSSVDLQRKVEVVYCLGQIY
jgi:hypothetical protein